MMVLSAKNNKKPVIIDVDTGIDDAVALSIAFACKNLDVLLITTGAGNVGAQQATENTLNIINLLKHPQIPVAMGESEPLKRKRNVVSVHGADGIGGYSKNFPKHNLKSIDKIAHQAMADAILSCKKPVTIIGLGPLTNIAKLLTLHPEAKKNIAEIVIMAGSIEQYAPGELPYFGFNVKVDPEACEEVVNATDVKIVVSPTDLGHMSYLTYEEVYKTKNLNMAGKIFEEIFRQYHDHHIKNGIAMHDSCAVAYVAHPEIFGVEKLHVYVRYYKELENAGVLRCEWNDPRNIDVCTSINLKKFKRLYFKSLAKTRTLED